MPFPIQNQTSQLKLKFAGPLVKDWQVTTRQDLITLDNNYEYKLVWVNEMKTFFYLNTGCSGADLSDWIQYGSSATITQHNQNQSYLFLRTLQSVTPITGCSYRVVLLQCT